VQHHQHVTGLFSLSLNTKQLSQRFESSLLPSSGANTNPISYSLDKCFQLKLLIKHADMVRYIKAQRVKWIGHIIKMDEERTVKRITVWRPDAVRRIGRLKLRWKDDVREDLGKMKIWNWSKIDDYG